MAEQDSASGPALQPVFPRDMLHLLRCSHDAGPLIVAEEFRSTPAGIIAAILRCGFCAAEYRIANGIACLMNGPLTAENEHEISIREAEYSGMPAASFVPPDQGWRSELSDLLEVPAHLEGLEPLENRLVLEIGCGDGRFTMLMAQRGARVLAVDFSLSALQKLASWLPSGLAPTTYRTPRYQAQDFRGRIGLVQADASRLHLAPRSFDRALSATPLDGRDERMAMYAAIADALSDGGRFVGSLEHDDLSRRILGLPVARRYSPGGIFIEHFDVPTMCREAAPYFSRMTIRPIRPRIPFMHKLPLKWGARLASWTGVVPGLRNLGEILLMRAECPVRPPVEGLKRPGSSLIKGFYRWYIQKKGHLPVWGSEPV